MSARIVPSCWTSPCSSCCRIPSYAGVSAFNKSSNYPYCFDSDTDFILKKMI